MSNNIVTSQSSIMGVTPKKPEFPTNHETTPDKYISIIVSSGQAAKNYDYWAEVVVLLSPILAKSGYQIVQIGGKEDKILPGVVNKLGLDIRNTAHVLRNASVSLSGDTFAVHLAGIYSTPLVAVYGSTNPRSVGPYWHGECELIEPEGLPSYRVEENPKRVNSIKPEIIAQKCLDLLGIDVSININTLFVGKQYHIDKVDIIPDMPLDVSKMRNITIRLDVINHESNAAKILAQQRCNVIAENPVSEQFLKAFKDKIIHFVYILKEGYSAAFVKTLHLSGVPYILISKLPEKFKDLQLEFNFDFNPVYPYVTPKIEVPKEAMFKTSRIFLSQGRVYSSLYHYRKNVVLQGAPQPIGPAVDDPEWIDGAESYLVFNQ